MKCIKLLTQTLLLVCIIVCLTACSSNSSEKTNAASSSEIISESQEIEIDSQLLKDLEERAKTAHAACALERFYYVDICWTLNEIANGNYYDPQEGLNNITEMLEKADKKMAEKEARFIASASEGTDFEEGTYMAEHGFKLYEEEQACIPNAAYIFMRDGADLSVNPMPDDFRELYYVDPDVIDKRPYTCDNTKVSNDNFGAYYDVNGSDEMQKQEICMTIYYEKFDGHEEYNYDGNYNIWWAFGIYDKYTGQLLFNDYLKTTTTTVTYNGKTADINISYVEDSKSWFMKDVEFKFTIEAPENYDGAVFTVIPVRQEADPSYNLDDYEPYELRFIEVKTQK